MSIITRSEVGQGVAINRGYLSRRVSAPDLLVRVTDEASVSIGENIVLARARYASGSAGAPIPRDVYVAVAQVIAELDRAGLLA